ncbi:MAG: DUF1425 domain-containing protein [Phycisphaerales bacterium]|nr:DUF1425 domain-containing protein [Phycisphaerales bacterium]
MTIARFMSPLLVATMLLSIGCGTVNTVSTRTTKPADTVHTAHKGINDLLTEIFLHCTDVRLFRSEPSGHLKVQIDVANDGFSTRTFAWKIVWLDAAGNTIESITNVWEGTSVVAGASVTLTSLAPRANATDFVFQLRRSDSF